MWFRAGVAHAFDLQRRFLLRLAQAGLREQLAPDPFSCLPFSLCCAPPCIACGRSLVRAHASSNGAEVCKWQVDVARPGSYYEPYSTDLWMRTAPPDSEKNLCCQRKGSITAVNDARRRTKGTREERATLVQNSCQRLLSTTLVNDLLSTT